MKLIITYIQPERLNEVKQALYAAEVYKMSVTNALGCGPSIFHCYFLRVFHFSLGFAFNAIGFHLFTSSSLFK